MSAAEVIEEILRLPDSEQQKVLEFLRSLDRKVEGAPQAQVSEEFKGMADRIFTNHADLFRKLAK